MHTPHFGPLCTAMVTPFDSQLNLNLPRLCELADHLIQQGTSTLVATGTTGEAPTLTASEKFSIWQTLKQHVGNRASLVAGTGTYSTAETIALSRQAAEAGMDGLLLVNPYYNKPSQDGLYRHFAMVAEAVDLPIILYNHPGRTGVCLSAQTVAKLALIPNIVGIKDSSGDLVLMADMRRQTPSDFLLYSGDDSLTLPVLAIGGYGVISVASHVVGTQILNMIQAFKRGDIQQAQQLHLNLLELTQVLFCAPSPAPVKAALQLLGLDPGGVRPPLFALSEQDLHKLQTVIQKTNLLET